MGNENRTKKFNVGNFDHPKVATLQSPLIALVLWVWFSQQASSHLPPWKGG